MNPINPRNIHSNLLLFGLMSLVCMSAQTAENWKPYSSPCVERSEVFEFTQKPTVQFLKDDNYKITFAVKGNCDVAVGIVDSKGKVIRHLGAGVLGSNAPEPFQKNSLKQTLIWDGKNDLQKYVKDPQKLKVQVQLGLKPTFDKLLGPQSPKALPGRVWGIAADADGVYVFARGRHRAHISCRKFNHDAEYEAAIYPPPANLPPEKLEGMGFVEYEPGKKSLHGPIINWSVWHEGGWMPPTLDGGSGVLQSRPAAADGKIYFLSTGFNRRDVEKFRSSPRKMKSKLYYINTDGSTTNEGIRGRLWFESSRKTSFPHLAASPDGKRIYSVGNGAERARTRGIPFPVLLGSSTQSSKAADVLVGNVRKEGTGNTDLNSPVDVACDAKGRVYVVDQLNNRIQVFEPDGSYLKTIKASRPSLVQVHMKTGEVYVSHKPTAKGKGTQRLTVYSAYPKLTEQRHWDNIPAAIMTLDSWSKKPRIWVADEPWIRTDAKFSFASEFVSTTKGTIKVYEDNGKKLQLISDFEKEAKKEAGKNFSEHWEGGNGDKVVCDPVREHVYVKSKEVPDWRYDLKTGKLLGPVPKLNGSKSSDLSFDKRGFMHAHTDYHGGKGKVVVRVNPDSFDKNICDEVPYNYGVSWGNWKGAVAQPTTDTQAWSWGMGVNLAGDIAVVNYIGYSPKFQDDAEIGAKLTKEQQAAMHVGVGRTFNPYKQWKNTILDREKRGDEMYYIPRRPGIPLSGSTIWTWDSHGELLEKAGVVAGRRVVGVQIDLDRDVYYTNARFKMINGKPFLFERGGNYGGDAYVPQNKTPFFGTFLKSPSKGVDFHLKKSPISRDWEPKGPADLASPLEGGFGAYGGERTFVWVEKAEWLYAGASPVVGEHCDCPQMRTGLDWYKRSFVPEGYRHSVGVLDTNGNLICHIGQYGNYDSGGGKADRVPLPKGSDGVATTRASYVSVTDNYLCMDDWGQRLIVVKLGYHKEEKASIPKK